VSTLSIQSVGIFLQWQTTTKSFTSPNHEQFDSVWTELETALQRSNSKFELYRYDAQHAFMNEVRPEVYDAVSPKTAWERTSEFLKKALA